MGKVIDIQDHMPHEAAEVLCWNCGHRWFSVFPEGTPLKILECPNCHNTGGVFKTGQTMETTE